MVALRLLGIHIFAVLAVWLGMYFPGLDIFLSFIYLIIISQEIYDLRGESLLVKGVAGLLWLGLPLILSLITYFKIISEGIFLLIFWYTPILPLLSIRTYVFSNGLPLYYYILLVSPLVFMAYFYLLVRRK